MTVPLWLQHAIATYGYLAILLAVALETMGVPFPGETSLLAGAVYAGTGGRLNIALVIAAAAAGAILGDNIGYTVGRYGGYPLLQRLARLLGIPESALAYAQRFFARHGDKTVLLGRFFSLLRTWVAFLAGVNRMPRRAFFFWNASGGILWAICYGVLGYALGHNLPLLNRVLGGMGTAGIAAIAAVVLLVIWLRWTHWRRLRRGPAATVPEGTPLTDAHAPPADRPRPGSRAAADDESASPTSPAAAPRD